MAGVNKAIILGRLGKDPELKYSQNSDKAVCRLSVAASEKWGDEEKVEWFNVVLFGRLAEVADQYLRKGEQVYVEGRIQTRKWTDRDGNDRYTTEIIGQNMQLIGGQKGQTAARDDDQSAPRPTGQDQTEARQFGR